MTVNLTRLRLVVAGFLPYGRCSGFFTIQLLQQFDEVLALLVGERLEPLDRSDDVAGLVGRSGSADDDLMIVHMPPISVLADEPSDRCEPRPGLRGE